MKHLALYSPYIPKHSGGGERYLLSIAEVLSRSHHTVLLVPFTQLEESKKALSRYEKIFGLDLSRLLVEVTEIGSRKSPLTTYQNTKKFDVLFAITDGSIFPSGAKHAYLIAQVPWTRSLSLSEKLKLHTWTKILVYSNFVRDILEKSWNTKKVNVLSPYVDLQDFTPGKKEKLIISTARFFAHSQSNSKRQDVLVDAFKELVDRYHPKGWQLSLLGSVDPNPDSHTFVSDLKKRARGYPVSIHTDITYDVLRAYYARASLYWHAAGYEVNEHKHPENTEHFGITTLEAMASGAIPLVVPKGGQVEIVNDPSLFWETPEELVSKANFLMHLPSTQKHDLRSTMRHKASVYAKDYFEQKVITLL